MKLEAKISHKNLEIFYARLIPTRHFSTAGVAAYIAFSSHMAITDHTLDYLKNRYDEELARFDHFENKCEKFITFVTVIIAAITAFSGLSNGAIFHPKTPISWVTLFVFIIGFIAIVASWGHALSALRVGDYSVMPRSRATAEYLNAVEEPDAKQHIYNCYVDTLEKVAVELAGKSKQLELAYEELVISAVCLGFVCISTASMEIFK